MWFLRAIPNCLLVAAPSTLLHFWQDHWKLGSSIKGSLLTWAWALQTDLALSMLRLIDLHLEDAKLESCTDLGALDEKSDKRMLLCFADLHLGDAKLESCKDLGGVDAKLDKRMLAGRFVLPPPPAAVGAEGPSWRLAQLRSSCSTGPARYS